MEVKDITPEVLDNHIDNILDVRDNIAEGKLTVLVGENGAGKSLLRKLMGARFNDGDKAGVRSVSMQLRTESRAEFGGLCTLMHDLPWSPTSTSTFHLIEQVMKVKSKDKQYVVLDEIEIGMSEESLAGLIAYIKQNLSEWLDKTLGVMVITHSRYVAEELMKEEYANFVYIGYNKVHNDIDEWLNRDIIPTDFNFLEKWSCELYRRVLDRSRGK